jgi:hypothetical protein
MHPIEFVMIFIAHHVSATIWSYLGVLCPPFTNVFVFLIMFHALFSATAVGFTMLMFKALTFDPTVTLMTILKAHLLGLIVFLYVYGRNLQFLNEMNKDLKKNKIIQHFIIPFTRQSRSKRKRNKNNNATFDGTLIYSSACLYVASVMTIGLIIAFDTKL